MFKRTDIAVRAKFINANSSGLILNAQEDFQVN